jgi:hypothetical protein
LLLVFASCGKTMTEEECDKIGAHMRKVWDNDSEQVAPETGKRSERASNAIKAEGDKMETEWKALCERELEGRKVDEQEIECILASKTVAEIQRCGTTKK